MRSRIAGCACGAPGPSCCRESGARCRFEVQVVAADHKIRNKEGHVKTRLATPTASRPRSAEPPPGATPHSRPYRTYICPVTEEQQRRRMGCAPRHVPHAIMPVSPCVRARALPSIYILASPSLSSCLIIAPQPAGPLAAAPSARGSAASCYRHGRADRSAPCGRSPLA